MSVSSKLSWIPSLSHCCMKVYDCVITTREVRLAHSLSQRLAYAVSQDTTIHVHKRYSSFVELETALHLTLPASACPSVLRFRLNFTSDTKSTFFLLSLPNLRCLGFALYFLTGGVDCSSTGSALFYFIQRSVVAKLCAVGSWTEISYLEGWKVAPSLPKLRIMLIRC